MTTEAQAVSALPIGPAAAPPTARPVSTKRVRAHRERLRLERRCVRIQVDKNSTDALVKLGYLEAAQAHDLGAIRRAVEIYVGDAPFALP